MKRLIATVMTVCMCFSIGILFTSCGDQESHEHAYREEWSYDGTHHWHACEGEACPEVADKAEHVWNDGELTAAATAEADGVKTFTCTVCGMTKAEAVAFGEEKKQAFVDPNPILQVHPHRSNLTKILHDEKGRLTEIWSVDDTLEWQYPYLVPTYSFEYGEDGRLIYYKGSSVESEIAYTTEGTPYFVESSVHNTSFSLESVSYHENGSVKQIAFYFGEQLQTDVYDENGRTVAMGWENSDGSNGEYRSSCEGNTQTITMVQNGELYDAEIVIEYNGDGNPLKQTTRMGTETAVEKEWVYDEKKLVSVSLSSKTIFLTYDDAGLLVRTETKKNGETTAYTAYTYDENGLRLSEKSYGGDDTNPEYQEGYTYTYEAGERKTVTREIVYDSARRAVYVYDAYSVQISSMQYNEHDGEYNGEPTRYYQESYTEYDGEGRIVLVTDTEYIDVNGVKTKRSVYTYRSDYNVPAGAAYEWVRLDSRAYYFDPPDGINGLTGEDMYLTEVHYVKRVTDGNSTSEKWVNEATGEILPEGSDKWRDGYGNYYQMENGDPTGTVIYYQKYCDGNGAYWYFTANGVKTPLQ